MGKVNAKKTVTSKFVKSSEFPEIKQRRKGNFVNEVDD